MKQFILTPLLLLTSTVLAKTGSNYAPQSLDNSEISVATPNLNERITKIHLERSLTAKALEWREAQAPAFIMPSPAPKLWDIWLELQVKGYQMHAAYEVFDKWSTLSFSGYEPSRQEVACFIFTAKDKPNFYYLLYLNDSKGLWKPVRLQCLLATERQQAAAIDAPLSELLTLELNPLCGLPTSEPIEPDAFAAANHLQNLLDSLHDSSHTLVARYHWRPVWGTYSYQGEASSLHEVRAKIQADGYLIHGVYALDTASKCANSPSECLIFSKGAIYYVLYLKSFLKTVGEPAQTDNLVLCGASSPAVQMRWVATEAAQGYTPEPAPQGSEPSSELSKVIIAEQLY